MPREKDFWWGFYDVLERTDVEDAGRWRSIVWNVLDLVDMFVNRIFSRNFNAFIINLTGLKLGSFLQKICLSLAPPRQIDALEALL